MGDIEERVGGLAHRMDIFEIRMDAREMFAVHMDGQRHELLVEIGREFGSLRTEMAGQTRTLVFSMIATFLTFAALVLGTVRFA